MDVVAPAVAVVDAQDGFQVGEQVRQRQKFADHLSDDGLAAQAAADQHLEADLTLCVALQVETNIVDLGSRTVLRRAGDRDLELPRQVREFGVVRRPLPQDLAVGTRVIDLVLGDAGHVIGGDIANAIATRLDRMHLHRGEMLQDIGNIGQVRPVQLQILAGREVTVAAIVATGHLAQLAQLARAQQSIRDRDAQHRRVPLDIETVTQAYGLELIFGELTGEETPRLVTEFRDTLVHEGLIQVIISVHGGGLYAAATDALNTVWLCRWLRRL